MSRAFPCFFFFFLHCQGSIIFGCSISQSFMKAHSFEASYPPHHLSQQREGWMGSQPL